MLGRKLRERQREEGNNRRKKRKNRERKTENLFKSAYHYDLEHGGFALQFKL